ncbi:hypothetical protein HNQ95_000721 [Aminobacter ciceronei]|jgi:hypothetical protein|uniref:Uncharacterized protein n=1 Tax=Aminobacter ciceronei TaxID=150723 RepID=A0ABR6C0K5_9HYPH|nr:hypothetical protein [Aminobacter ciceronei]MBA8904957.1 hypothetical protein [Aminobacter ciceronei]MBA9018489.1 hypothetical protein [Aminobacter ciceronei]
MANETVPANRTTASGRRQIIKGGAAITAGLALVSVGLSRAKATGTSRATAPDSRKPLSLCGIVYDTGTNYWPGQLSRQIWNRAVVQEEMRVIRAQLLCNAISISGTNIQRLEQAATAAFGQGLQVWMQPRLFDASRQDMLTYLGEIATMAETLGQRHGKLVLNVGCELSMFTQGFVEGGNFQERMATLQASPVPLFPDINKALGEHLAQASEIARKHFKGEITYKPDPLGGRRLEAVRHRIGQLLPRRRQPLDLCGGPARAAAPRQAGGHHRIRLQHLRRGRTAWRNGFRHHRL